MSLAKRASGSESAPPMAAGVALQQMRRRVRLGRMGVWGAVAAGPVALAVAVTGPPTVVEAATPATPTAVRTVAAADPSGYAEVFLGAWLRSSATEDGSAQARLVQSMAPDVELPDLAASAQAQPRDVVAVRSVQRSAGRWSVTVAAQYADGGVRYFVVPVVADSGGGSFAVAGAPGAVAGPARAGVPQSPYSVTVTSDSELSSTVGEFLTAYLAGAGGVDRYLAPGVKLSALSPAAFSAATVKQLLAVEEVAAAASVPKDGTRARVWAQVEAQDASGRWPLAYELTLEARSGRWEVAALESGTAQSGGGRS
ncbi:conjugal transfer protein [Streptomyces sp. NPDC059909]|uniref:conjugal transfer protein n=1 Tax=Streptomyces sp. NPDC059909 TaxID=3346998 RepID=UPI00366999B4